LKKISVAIPTYFSSKFITDTINSLKDNKIVNEIIICDDSEDKEEYSRLVNLVSSLLENSDIKLNIQKNKPQNFFSYLMKGIVVLKSLKTLKVFGHYS